MVELTNLTEQLQEKLSVTIKDLNQKNGDLASILEKKLNPIIDKERGLCEKGANNESRGHREGRLQGAEPLFKNIGV
jgi:hypothetical protein